MARSLGIGEAELLAFFVQSALWGIYFITLFQCLRHFLLDPRSGDFKSVSNIKWGTLSVTVVLAFLSTLNVVLGVVRARQAFIAHPSPGGTATFLGLRSWDKIVSSCNLLLGKLVSDGVLVYRCWIIYSKSWTIIAFPIVLWAGFLATAIYGTYLQASSHDSQALLTSGLPKLTPTITAGWSASLLNNIIATGLIVHRIWQVDKETREAFPSRIPPESRTLFRRKKTTRLQSVTRAIIESGLLYTTIALITFITFLVGNNFFYVTSYAELQILSIAFNLLFIRMSKQPAEEDYSVGSTLPALPPIVFVRPRLHTSMMEDSMSHPTDVMPKQLPEPTTQTPGEEVLPRIPESLVNEARDSHITFMNSLARPSSAHD